MPYKPKRNALKYFVFLEHHETYFMLMLDTYTNSNSSKRVDLRLNTHFLKSRNYKKNLKSTSGDK